MTKGSKIVAHPSWGEKTSPDKTLIQFDTQTMPDSRTLPRLDRYRWYSIHSEVLWNDIKLVLGASRDQNWLERRKIHLNPVL